MTVELRVPELADAAAIADFANRVADELFGEQEETETSVRQWLTAPELGPDDIRIVVRDEGVVGYADLAPRPEPKYWVDLRVPVSEADDVRVALLEWADDRARKRGAAVLRTFVWNADAPVKRLLERAGFALIRHSYRMRIDFDGDVGEPAWPAGIAVRSATEADVENAYETHMETFEDSWEHSREPFEEWRHWMVREDLDWTMWFMAEAGGEPAGVALCREHDSESGLGWVDILGVRRPWRRQGLGRALLVHAFGEFRRRGFHGAALGVDAESLTGANRLYESAGMRVVRQGDIYEKRLAA